MSCSLNPLKGAISGRIIGGMKGDIRSLQTIAHVPFRGSALEEVL